MWGIEGVTQSENESVVCEHERRMASGAAVCHHNRIKQPVCQSWKITSVFTCYFHGWVWEGMWEMSSCGKHCAAIAGSFLFIKMQRMMKSFSHIHKLWMSKTIRHKPQKTIVTSSFALTVHNPNYIEFIYLFFIYLWCKTKKISKTLKWEKLWLAHLVFVLVK